ncbi:hypothetical protein N9W34_03415 [Rickettsiales bacterium]|nr:hypothetical protein [Rickettsiales bacterium]
MANTDPAITDALNRASLFIQQGMIGDANNILVQIINHDPNIADAYHLLGIIAYQQAAFNDSIALIGKAVEINPANPVYYNNLANSFVTIGNQEAAEKFYKKALMLDRNSKNAVNNLGSLLYNNKRYEEEIKLCKSFLQHNKESYDIIANLIKSMKMACYYNGLDGYKRIISNNIDNSPCPVTPYSSLALNLSFSDQAKIAKNFASEIVSKTSEIKKQLNFSFAQNSDKIKIAYIGSDFRDHPTSHLLRAVIKNHNRDKFEVHIFSYGKNDGSQYRKDFEKYADYFHDLENHNFIDIARKINEQKIDIAMDVMGYIMNSYPQIYALRPAPIQINYLAYPGSMGADFIDYAIMDKTALSDNEAQYFTEQPIYMPNSYFATDDEQEIGIKPSKKQCGLPEDKLILCCFNKSNKISPKVIDSWARIMSKSDNSIIWLYADNDFTKKNLYKEFKKRNISKSRVIFASRANKSEHLARLQNADLFLDCFEICAHTTAIDALWAGVPILTLMGDKIINRASASIIKAAGFAELIVNNVDDYEKLAIELANDVNKLRELKNNMQNQVKTSPLFNNKQYVKDLENALLTVISKKSKSVAMQ